MSGPKSGSWKVTEAGAATMSWADAFQLLLHYKECILHYPVQLAALQRRQPEWRIKYEVDTLSTTTPNLGEIVAAELNNRYEIYIRLRDAQKQEAAQAALAAKAAETQARIDEALRRAEAQTRAEAQARSEIQAREDASRRAAAIGERLGRSRESLPQPEADTGPRMAHIAGQAQAALAGLDLHASPELIETVKATVRACLAESDLAAAELRLADVRVRLRAAKRDAELRARQEAEIRDQEAAAARSLLQRLGGGGGGEAMRGRLVAASLGDARLDPALREEAEAAVKRNEVGFAGSVLREALQQLGYDVSEGFDTLGSQGGSGFFQRPSWGEHSVQIRLDGERGRLNMHVVRYGDEAKEIGREEALRDREMEARWCDEVPRLLEALGARGVEVDLTRKLAPGAVPVHLVSDDRIKTRRAGSTTETAKARQKARSLDSRTG